MTHKTTVALGLPALLLCATALMPVAGHAQQQPPQAQQQPQFLAPPTSPANARALQADQRQGQYFDINGSHIFYQVSGNGPPMLLIHGYPLSGEMFDGQRRGLSNEFTVITLDLPGYGKSHAASSNGSIEDYAHDVLGLMDHLQIQKAIIGGHSMGGVITMELYKEVPQRFAGMVLIDTNAKKAPPVGMAEWDAYAAQAQQMGVDSTVSLLIPQMLTGRTRIQNTQATSELENVVREASVDAFVAGGHALANRADYTSMLGSIHVPTLVIVGVDDPLWAFPLSQMMHQMIPGSRLAILPGAAHASVYEQPQEANNAIRQWAMQQHMVAGNEGSGNQHAGPQGGNYNPR